MGLNFPSGEWRERFRVIGDMVVFVCIGGEEVDNRYGGRLCLSMCEVVVCVTVRVEHAAWGFVRGNSLGEISIAIRGFLLFLFLNDFSSEGA